MTDTEIDAMVATISQMAERFGGEFHPDPDKLARFRRARTMAQNRFCDLPTGDKGQRFQITAMGYPKDGFNVIGWSNSEVNATKIAQTILKAPGCTTAQVYDRTTDFPVATFSHGQSQS
jgi:hypothetical protein